MNADTFWQLIDDARGAAEDPSDAEAVAALVTAGLARLSAEEIVDFAVLLEGLQAESNHWDLWAATYLINDGCSDDGFDYFRGWLVTRGRAVWDAALADPDSLASLADLVDRDNELEVFCEELLAAAPTAYGRVTGDGDAFWDALPGRADGGDLPEPGGEEFDFDDERQLRARLPRLAAALLDAA